MGLFALEKINLIELGTTPLDSNELKSVQNIMSSQLAMDTYRFGGDRYSFKAVSGTSPCDPIPQIPGAYAFPNGETDPEAALISSAIKNASKKS
jgi:hypothetical protein